jgi:SPP1 gp7 family putative phage head morphogenesis protein
MRKYPLKGMVRKEGPSPVDNWLYPSTRFTAKLSKEAQRALAILLAASIPRVIAEYNFDVAFDVVNERAIAWLNEYVIDLSGKLEEINVHDLKTALMEGIDAGESMDKLRARVNDVFETYDKARAEMVARTETIRSQETGNRLVYKEAGFTRKVWFANAGCCDICEALDNVDIPIDEPFDFDDGGYSDRMAPPAHPNCRCSSGPWDDSWGA